MIHEPAIPHCDICRPAEVREAPRFAGKSEMGAAKLGENASGDFIIDGKTDELVRGVGGYKDAFNLRGEGSMVKIRYPSFGRDEADCYAHVKKFGGLDANSKSHSDS